MWIVPKCSLLTQESTRQVVACCDSITFPDIDRIYPGQDDDIVPVIQGLIQQRASLDVGQRLPGFGAAVVSNETLTLRCELYSRVFLIDVKPAGRYDEGVPLSCVVQRVTQDIT